MWFQNQHKEINFGTYKETNFPWIPSGLQQDKNFCTIRENEKDSTRSTESFEKQTTICPEVELLPWTDKQCVISDLSRNNQLTFPTKKFDSGTQTYEQLEFHICNRENIIQGTKMVDCSSETLQPTTDESANAENNITDSNRCFRNRLESNSERKNNLQKIDSNRKETNAQSQGTSCDLQNCPIVSEPMETTTHNSAERQHNSSGLRKLLRIKRKSVSFTNFKEITQTIVQKQNQVKSTVSTRNTKCSSRQSKSNVPFLARLRSKEKLIQQDKTMEFVQLENRSICNSNNNTTSEILCNVSSGISGNRRICSPMGQERTLCLSTNQNDIENDSGIPFATSTTHDPSDAVLDCSNLVAITENTCKEMSKSGEQCNKRSGNAPIVSSGKLNTFGMGTRKRKLEELGYDTRTASIMSGNLRKSTQENYASKLRIYKEWCIEKNYKFDKYDVKHACKFFTHLLLDKHLLASSM